MYVKPGSDTYLTLCFAMNSFKIDLGKIMRGRDCMLNFSVDK